MPRVKTTAPEPSREKGERNLELPEVLYRILPPWQQPEWYEADQWRKIVARQPIATICRETLIEYVLALDWKIEPRDSEKRDEYKSEIDYYTRFFQFTGDYDYPDIIQWIGRDALDIPFGGAAELGHEGDSPEGKILWIELLDGGTLFPTLNSTWPYGQALKEAALNPVYFPAHAINRLYFSPRTEIRRKGWGFAPPEKIYLALELMNRGDVYYANLLLDTPPTGILDLMDFDKLSAEEWLKSWRTLLGGTDPFKIPVLYQHEKQAAFIPFTKSPTELMFDKATYKYSSIIAAGYGLTLSDIGMQVSSSGGETLAGSIRSERRTRKSGVAVMKRKFKAFFDRMLPPYLQWLFIDLDDETSVAIGRARLASATAWAQLLTSGVFTPEEARQQTIADGLISISVPEKIPEDANLPDKSKQPERPSMLGRPVAPSAGGQGEIRSDILSEKLASILEVEPIRLRKLIRQVILPIKSEISGITEVLEDDDLLTWNSWEDDILWNDLIEGIPEITLSSIQTSMALLDKPLQDESWWKIEIDPKTVADDLIDTFKNIRLSRLRAKAALRYEKGEINVLETEFKDDPIFTRKCKVRIASLTSDVLSKIPVCIKKAIISGTRKYLSSIRNATSLDTDAIMSDNLVVEYVKRELESSISNLLYEFADRSSVMIDNLLGDN